MRIGHGYDVHRLVEGRKLILGGVEIPHRLGLDGHSDADVLVHAIMDSLLGAAALGDIGRLFPDTDDAYLGIDSMILLDRVRRAVWEKGYTVGNVDCTVLAQKPKLAPFIPQMKTRIAQPATILTSEVGANSPSRDRRLDSADSARMPAMKGAKPEKNGPMFSCTMLSSVSTAHSASAWRRVGTPARTPCVI